MSYLINALYSLGALAGVLGLVVSLIITLYCLYWVLNSFNDYHPGTIPPGMSLGDAMRIAGFMVLAVVILCPSAYLLERAYDYATLYLPTEFVAVDKGVLSVPTGPGSSVELEYLARVIGPAGEEAEKLRQNCEALTVPPGQNAPYPTYKNHDFSVDRFRTQAAADYAHMMIPGGFERVQGASNLVALAEEKRLGEFAKVVSERLSRNFQEVGLRVELTLAIAK